MKLLVVKLADMGDVLTATPALRAARESLKGAEITALVTPGSAAVLEGSPLVDRLLTFDKFRYDQPKHAMEPSTLKYGVDFFQRLRYECFDAIAILHHLTTRWGALKYAALALASGASRRAGLDNGRGWFLTEKADDYGFGGRHEVEYWLEVMGLLGAKMKPYPMETPPKDDEAEFNILPDDTKKINVALHPGGGGYSRARRWTVERFAWVANRLAEDFDANIILLGGNEEDELAAQLDTQLDNESINLAGKTSLKELAEVLRRCHLFIGGDSGVMHMAAACGTPMVAIFGPTNANAWGPWVPGGKAIVVQSQNAGCPCLYVGRETGNVEGCQSLGCLASISQDMVLEAAQRLLNGQER
jgi:heptosyltransferase-2